MERGRHFCDNLETKDPNNIDMDEIVGSVDVIQEKIYYVVPVEMGPGRIDMTYGHLASGVCELIEDGLRYRKTKADRAKFLEAVKNAVDEVLKEEGV